MINDLNDLKKLLSLCRKQGVTEIKLGAVELKFGDMPINQEQAVDPDAAIDDLVGLDPTGLDPLAFYSVTNQ